MKFSFGETWDEEKALRWKNEKKEKSRVWKAERSAEEASVPKRARTTKSRAQKKINLDSMEEVDEDNMNLTQIMKNQTSNKPRRRLIKVATKKGRNVGTPEVMVVDQTPEVVEAIIARRKRGTA